jgi:hypothetical protein
MNKKIPLLFALLGAGALAAALAARAFMPASAAPEQSAAAPEQSAAAPEQSAAAPEQNAAAGGPPAPPPLDVSKLASVEGASVEQSRDAIITRLPTSECIDTKATPLVIGDQIVFGTHRRAARPGGPYESCGQDSTPTGIFAVSSVDGTARTVHAGVDAEATGIWAEATLLTPLVGRGGGISAFHDGAASVASPVRIGTDTAPIWDPDTGRFIVGTVNVPNPMCQSGPNPDCGMVMALNRDGTMAARLDRTENFRAWVAAGLTTDGTSYYLGTGASTDGQQDRTDSRGCAVVKLDKALKIVAEYDDGPPGCRTIGRLESAVIGEVPVVGDTLWAQYLGDTSGEGAVPVVKLDRETLQPICRAAIPAVSSRSLASFYQGPVVDEQGRAYISTFSQRGLGVYRINADCSYDLLTTASPGAKGLSALALAEDQFVLAAEPGYLLVIDRESGRTKRHRLGSTEEVVSGPVITPHGVAVVSKDGTVTHFTDLDIDSYGQAPWPRFRKDNLGRAGGSY